jgi:hypothetical protein
MTDEQFNQFLGACAWICAFGALLNLFLVRRRGASAVLLAAAFGALAGTLLLVRVRADQALVGVAAMAVLGLLVADFAVRMRKRESSR